MRIFVKLPPAFGFYLSISLPVVWVTLKPPLWLLRAQWQYRKLLVLEMD